LDINNLLNQFMGGQAGQTGGGMNDLAAKAKGLIQQATQGGMGGFAGGAAAGGLLTLLLSSGKVRKMAGGVLGYGGAAVLGAMAHKAFQNYQAGKTATAAQPVTQQDMANVDQKFLPSAMPAANGQPFGLTLIKGMIAAAKADGHMDATEQQRIFGQVEEMGLPPDAKAFVFDALSQPVDLVGLTAGISTPEQAAELYMASRLAIDPDQPAEQAYLATLASRLKLPPDLVAHLDQQVQQGVAQQQLA